MVAVVAAAVVPAVVPVEAVVVLPVKMTVTPGPVLGMTHNFQVNKCISDLEQRAREAGCPRLGRRDWRG